MNKNSVHKQSCPTCGQSVNMRRIPCYKDMFTSLWNVFQWCERKQVHEFKKSDVKHLFTSDVVSSVFAYLRWFGGLVYSPDDVKGHYGLNMERCREFFAGTLEIPTDVWTNPLTGEIEMNDYRTIDNMPKLTGFLDENQNFIVKYKEPQRSLF